MVKHWIFPLERPLSPQEIEKAKALLNQIGQHWKAHNVPVPSEMEVRRQQFVFVKALDFPSGCSVDWLNGQMQQLAQQFGTRLADASAVFYVDEHQSVQQLDFRAAEDAIAKGILNPETLILDNTVVHSGDFTGWEKPLKNSWLKRYLPTATP